MSNFKTASKMKLRFNTDRGVLSVEQLWDLSLNSLSSLIRSSKELLVNNNDDELSFLGDLPVAHTDDQLRFDILKEVFLDKKSAIEAANNAKADKEYNQKILAEIARRKDKRITEISDEELEALLKK